MRAESETNALLVLIFYNSTRSVMPGAFFIYVTSIENTLDFILGVFILRGSDPARGVGFQ